MTPDAADLDGVVRALRQSKRYAGVAEALLQSLAAESLQATGGSRREATKRAKRRLHQIAGAYAAVNPRHERLLDDLARACEQGAEAVRAVLRRAMSTHASSRERLPILDEFYAAIFARVGRPRSILDLACGLNPLAAPWMLLTSGAEYRAVDIDGPLLGFVGAALDLLGVRRVTLLADALTLPLAEEADLTLLLKSLPCLEQQRGGSGVALLRRLTSPTVIVSFPTRSLGGRSKGMREAYAHHFEAAARAEAWDLERLDFASELVYVVHKR